jgi:hypothetical protein
MNPETEKNINETIDWLQQTGGQLQDFAAKQAPLYCREIVAWEFWNGLVLGTIGLLLLAVGGVALAKFLRWMREGDGEPNARTMTSMCIALMALTSGSCLLLSNTTRTIKAAVAPRLVIVEHLRQLP